MSDSDAKEDENVILHVAVLGFHHKKGTVLEYSYPPLSEGQTHSSSVLPPCWSCLPALALPDGAHQHNEDSSYFLLPSKDESNKTVFGISCYRQIETKKLKVKDKDVTRDTVQKSVVLISTKPVFGVLKAKLEMVSAAFFEERDFSQVQILKELHEQVNRAVSSNINEEIYLTGLSPRELVVAFRHRALILFKLMLLEKRLIFFGSAAGLGRIVLTLVSLFPRLPENGLYMASGELSDDLDENVNEKGQVNIDNEDAISHKSIRSVSDDAMKSPILEQIADGLNKLGRRGSTLLKDFIEIEYMDLSDEEGVSNGLEEPGLHEVAGFGSLVLELPTPPREEPRPEVIPESPFETDKMGYPLAIFTSNHLLLPYACLQQHSILKDRRKHNGFIAASSNVLFKAQKQLSDVMVEAEAPYDIEYRDSTVEKALKLTPADLRFIDDIITKVESAEDTGWVGSDSWIRAEFKKYLNGLLFTTMTTEGKIRDDYGRSYIDLVTKTKFHKIWRFGPKPDFLLSKENFPHPAALPTQNPFTDFKLRITSSLQSTQRGRVVEEAITNTVDKTVKTAGSWLSALKNSSVSQLQNMVQNGQTNQQ